MASVSSTRWAVSIAAFGAPVEGWPNSMWMIERPSAFNWMGEAADADGVERLDLAGHGLGSLLRGTARPLRLGFVARRRPTEQASLVERV